MSGPVFSGFLKQSTAVTVKVGPFNDKTDGFTPETALTISAAEFKLSKNGGALAAKNESTALAHDANAMYTCLFDTTDTNTLGILVGIPADTAADHRPFSLMWVVLPANVYDALIGASVYLKVDLTQILTVAVNTAVAQVGANMVSGSAGAITSTVLATDSIDADALKTDGITEIVDAVVAALQAGIDSGAVASGASGTVTLAASASATTDFYKLIIVRSPTGVVQIAECTAYNGTTKVATITPNWGTTPDNTYQYVAIRA